MKNKNVTFLTQAAMIAAIYVVLTLLFRPISFGEIHIIVPERAWNGWRSAESAQ